MYLNCPRISTAMNGVDITRELKNCRQLFAKLICIFNEKNNSFARTARAFVILVHFFVVLAKTTTRNFSFCRQREQSATTFFSYHSLYQSRSFQFKFLDSSCTLYIRNELLSSKNDIINANSYFSLSFTAPSSSSSSSSSSSLGSLINPLSL